MRPRFYHDCTKCIFLGEIVGGDAYYCAGDRHTTYIIRFSNNGPDYVSAGDFSNGVYRDLAQSFVSILSTLAPQQANYNELYTRRVTLIRLLTSEIAHRMENQHGN